MMVRLAWVCALGAISACGTINPVDGDAGSDAGFTGFTVDVDPANVFVRQGEQVAVMVTVQRMAGNEDEVTISADDLPDGVTAAALTIPSDETEAMLTLTAEAGATQGAVSVSVVGESEQGSRSAAMRLLVGGAPGTLDLSFGTDGKLLFQFMGMATNGRGVGIQADGKIVLFGATSTQAIVARTLPDGEPDPGWGTNGIVATGVGDSSGALAAVRLPDRRLAVAGWSGGAGGTDNDYAAYMFDDQGAVDTSFGDSGHVIDNPGAGFAELHAIVRDSQGGLVLAGTQFETGSTTHFFRYSDQGDKDTDFTELAVTGAFVEAMRIDVANNIVVVGSKNGNFWIARLLSGGEFDDSFNASGELETDLGNVATAHGLVELPGGKLLSVGIVQAGGTMPKIAIARYNANGTHDNSFNGTGRLVTAVDMTSRAIDGLVRDGQGRFLFIGGIPPAAMPTFAVTRFLPTGEPDTAFNGTGIVPINFGLATNAQSGPYGIAIDADGRIVVAGTVGTGAGLQFAVARIWP